MRIYRLHNQADLWEGPFTTYGMSTRAWDCLRDHRCPFAYALSPQWHRRADHREGYYAWSTIQQMWGFLRYPERDWPEFFKRMYVSIIETTDYHILPDGQVMFMQEGSWVISTITSTRALRALAQEA